MNLKLGLFPRTIFNISNLEDLIILTSYLQQYWQRRGGQFFRCAFHLILFSEESDCIESVSLFLFLFIWSGFDFVFGRERLYWFCFSDPNSVEGLPGSIIHYHFQVQQIQDPRRRCNNPNHTTLSSWKFLKEIQFDIVDCKFIVYQGPLTTTIS